jgi:hypothetical protein
MRVSPIILAAITIAGLAAPAVAETFTYTGTHLRPGSGHGVKGATKLAFTVTARRPAQGACVAPRIVAVADGANTLAGLLAEGYVLSKDSTVQICSDATTGKLTEALYVNLSIRSGGVVEAAYTWKSADPQDQGGTPDSVESYINLEYFYSGSTRPGHIRRQHGA